MSCVIDRILFNSPYVPPLARSSALTLRNLRDATTLFPIADSFRVV